MRLGVSTLSRGAIATREGYMAVAQLADRLGYAFVSVNDHVVVPEGIASRYPYSESGAWAAADEGHCFEQLSTLAFLAGCTSKVRLLTSVMVVPHRHPVLAAKMIATADVLSGGRIDVGVGAGWMKEELEVLGAPFADRGRATDEYLAAFKELWTKARPSFAGRHVRFDKVLFAPKPLQRPHPPIWIGGESEAALNRVARLGDAWYPCSSNPARRLDTEQRLGEAIGAMRTKVAAAGRDPASVGIGYVVQWPVSWKAETGSDGRRRFMTGSPADMAEDAARLGRLGVGHISLRLQADTLAETLERIERFGREVIPLVKA